MEKEKKPKEQVLKKMQESISENTELSKDVARVELINFSEIIKNSLSEMPAKKGR